MGSQPPYERGGWDTVRRERGGSADRASGSTENLVVRNSPISGQGLFAAAPIETGRVVMRLGGRLVSAAELESFFSPLRSTWTR